MSDQADKMADMKLWFEANHVLDQRAECLPEVRKILDIDSEMFLKLNITQLNRMQWKLSQYKLTLGELTSKLVAETNFSYLYRKNRYSSEWKRIKNHVEVGSNKMTVKETDERAEIESWENRCVETFRQERADLFKAILAALESFIITVRSRVRELDGQRFEKSTDNYSPPK